MVKPVFILVEGPVDKRFIEFLLKRKLNVVCDNTSKTGVLVEYTSGKSRLVKRAESLQKNTENEGINLVIYDRDFDDNNNYAGYPKERLLALKAENDIAFELFLMPNDESGKDGEGFLETLLSRIAHKEIQPIFKCLNDYRTCIQSVKDESGETMFDIKDIPKQVLQTTYYARIGKELKVTDESFFDFDASALEPLVNFLKQHLTQANQLPAT
jgi:hypothetical protein